MTSAEKRKFSAVFNAQSNETSVEKHSLQRCLPPTHADQEDISSVSGISELLKVTEEPQEDILKHDLEIPPEAEIMSIPLSSFPSKMQQLMSTRAKNISEVRQATEIPTVTLIWPVIKVEETSSPFWDNFLKSLIPTSLNITEHYSSLDAVTEDVKCSQIAPVKQLAQEEPDRMRARSYRLVIKSSNSVVSEILRSLTSIKDKDYKNMLPHSSISATGKQQENPLFKGSAVVIYDGQVYLLYVMKHEALSPEVEIHSLVTLLGKTTFCLIACCSIHEVTTKVPHSLLSGQYVVKKNKKCLRTLASPTHQDKTSNATNLSSLQFSMTTASQPEQCCSSTTGKRQQFLAGNVSAFPSTESVQERNEKEARWEEDNRLRKKFVIDKDVRVHLHAIRLPGLTEDPGKAATLKWKVTTRKTRNGKKCQRLCPGLLTCPDTIIKSTSP